MLNYSEYLKSKLMVGQIDPWRVDIDGKPIFALLVPFSAALEECQGWSNSPELTRSELLTHLKNKNIFVFRNVDEFGKFRDNLREEEKLVKIEKRGHKKQISEERRQQLRERMINMNNKKAPSP